MPLPTLTFTHPKPCSRYPSRLQVSALRPVVPVPVPVRPSEPAPPAPRPPSYINEDRGSLGAFSNGSTGLLNNSSMGLLSNDNMGLGSKGSVGLVHSVGSQQQQRQGSIPPCFSGWCFRLSLLDTAPGMHCVLSGVLRR